jgi:hypothetical protein
MLEGQPTFFFALKDPRSRITKMFALVNIAKHQLVGIGASIQAARTDYLAKLRVNGQVPLNTPYAELFETQGRLLRWGHYTQGGETFYSFVMDGVEDRIFIAGTSFPEAPISAAGDRVRLRAMKTDESIWTVVNFDNLEFDQQLSPDERMLRGGF